MQASWVMDLHAHLSNYEVIGLLGGTWDADNKRIQVIWSGKSKRSRQQLWIGVGS